MSRHHKLGVEVKIVYVRIRIKYISRYACVCDAFSSSDVFLPTRERYSSDTILTSL